MRDVDLVATRCDAAIRWVGGGVFIGDRVNCATGPAAALPDTADRMIDGGTIVFPTG